MALNIDLVPDTTAIALRVGAALLLGAVLGINRDLHRKPAGLRTHALVSIGSALVIMLVLMATQGAGDALSRAIQGLVTGIGFVGAGVIMHHEAERRVEGGGSRRSLSSDLEPHFWYSWRADRWSEPWNGDSVRGPTTRGSRRGGGAGNTGAPMQLNCRGNWTGI